MKVYFTASLRGVDEYSSYYKTIYEQIEKLGYVNLDDEIFQLHSEDYYEEIEDKGADAYKDLYSRKVKKIASADICVFESSIHSSSIGFQIQKALDENKPTIVLYYKEEVPHFLAGVDQDQLIMKSYNEKNLKKVIKESLDIARERRDKRFNFFISPKLLDYLEKASTDEGITKSKFIRNLIVNRMRRDNVEE